MGATSLKRRFGGRGARAARRRRSPVYTMFPVLGKRRKERGSNLSGGQQQMLAIGRALAAQPDPAHGRALPRAGAPRSATRSTPRSSELRDEGQSLIVVEESSRRALDFADRALRHQAREKVLEDEAAAMKQDDACSRRTSASSRGGPSA